MNNNALRGCEIKCKHAGITYFFVGQTNAWKNGFPDLNNLHKL